MRERQEPPAATHHRQERHRLGADQRGIRERQGVHQGLKTGHRLRRDRLRAVSTMRLITMFSAAQRG